MPIILALVLLLAPVAVSGGELRAGGLVQGGVVSVPAAELLPVGIMFDVVNGGKARFRLQSDPKDTPGHDLPVQDHLRYRHDLYVSVEDLRALAEVECYPVRQLVVIKTGQGWMAFRYGDQSNILHTFSATTVVGDLGSSEFHQPGNACLKLHLPIEFSGLDEAVTARFHPCKVCFPGGCPPFDQDQQLIARREASFQKALKEYEDEIKATQYIAVRQRSAARAAQSDARHNVERNWSLKYREFSIPLGSTGDNQQAALYIEEANWLLEQSKFWGNKTAELRERIGKEVATYQKRVQDVEDQRRAAFATAIARTLQLSQKRRDVELSLCLTPDTLAEGLLRADHNTDYVIAATLAQDFAAVIGEARGLRYGDAEAIGAANLLTSSIVSAYRDAAKEGQTDRTLAIRKVILEMKDEVTIAAMTTADSELRQSIIGEIQRFLDVGEVGTVSERLQFAQSLYPDEPKFEQFRGAYTRITSLRRLEEAKQEAAAGEYSAAVKIASEAQAMQMAYPVPEVGVFVDLLYGKLTEDAVRLEKAEDFDGARKGLMLLDGLELSPNQQSQKEALSERFTTDPQLLALMGDPAVESSGLVHWCLEHNGIERCVTRAKTGNWSPAVHFSVLLFTDPNAAGDTYRRFLDSIGQCPKTPLSTEDSSNLRRLALRPPPLYAADREQHNPALVHPLRVLLDLSNALDGSDPNGGLERVLAPRLCALMTSCGTLQSDNVQCLCAFVMATMKLPSLAEVHSRAAGGGSQSQSHISLSLRLATALQRGDLDGVRELTTALEKHLAAEPPIVGYPFYLLACAYEALGASNGKRALVEKKEKALTDAWNMNTSLARKTYGTITLNRAGVSVMRECMKDLLSAEGKALAQMPATQLPEAASQWPELLQQYLVSGKVDLPAVVPTPAPDGKGDLPAVDSTRPAPANGGAVGFY